MLNEKKENGDTSLRIPIDPTWIRLTDWKSKLSKKVGKILSYSDVINMALDTLEREFSREKGGN
ncbi:MAG: hypothetical protein GPW19_03025 [Euryarchaeota archaeon]|nr:hypothetical protein [Euryarchaeota archaeon]